MERLERPEQKISRCVEPSACCAFRQEVEVSAWSNSRLRTYPIRKWIGPDDLRRTLVRFRFPNMPVQQVRVVARVTTRMQHANAKLLPRCRREDGRHRIAA